MQNLTAKDVMNSRVLSARLSWSLSYLVDFLIDNGISGVPVVGEDGTLVGVVSLTDIVRHDAMPVREPQLHGPHAFYLHHLESGLTTQDTSSLRLIEDTDVTVRDIMTPTVFSVAENTPISQIADTLIKGRIHRLFVTRGGKVEGIITALDLLKVIRDLDEPV